MLVEIKANNNQRELRFCLWFIGKIISQPMNWQRHDKGLMCVLMFASFNDYLPRFNFGHDLPIGKFYVMTSKLWINFFISLLSFFSLHA
jgi:hypothetical protein